MGAVSLTGTQAGVTVDEEVGVGTLRRRLRVLVAKTPVASIVLTVAAAYGLWHVTTATTVGDFVRSEAELVDGGLYVAVFPVTPAASIAAVTIVDAKTNRHAATLVRAESTGDGTRVWVRVEGQPEVGEPSMELRVGERTLLTHAVEALFGHDP